MPTKENEKLLKRIAKLVKQNQDLENQLRELSKKYEEQTEKLEENERLLEKNSIKKSEKKQVSNRQDHLRFEMATVLFANIHGFTKLSDHKNSEELMDELDQIFIHFDQITKKYKIQKIKTIGDAYMAAGGIPVKNITNPVEVVMAAIEMKQYLNKPVNYSNGNKSIWNIGFGIHTGPVTAGLSGKRKISYDIKGDTVNIATRVESSSDLRKVIISVMTYELVKEFFECEYYGKIPVKYKGDLEMYEVKGLKPEFSKNNDKITPNRNFEIKFLLIQFTDIQEFVLGMLENELPGYLYYHNVKHTVDVVTQVELIGWGEGVSEEEILLLKTAALFHDAGHTIGYDNHEENGVKLAKQYLPRFNYTDDQIERISKLIMATKLPPDPKNKLEKIMCDADLDYLGRSDFIPVSNTLYDELRAQNKIGSLNDWNKLQLKFISNHHYYTDTAKSLREVNKQKQIERIKKEIINDENQ
jgi:class 3 adenylate cyclase